MSQHSVTIDVTKFVSPMSVNKIEDLFTAAFERYEEQTGIRYALRTTKNYLCYLVQESEDGSSIQVSDMGTYREIAFYWNGLQQGECGG